MKKVLRYAFFVILFISFGLGTFAFLNFVWDFGMKDPAQSLTLSRCPQSSSDSWNAYISEVGKIQQEAGNIQLGNLTYEEAAQGFEGVAVELEGLSYPSCAEPLQRALYTSFTNEAMANASKVEGGILGGFRYEYYHEKAVKNMYLVPFIIRLLEPPFYIPNWRFTT